VYDEELKLALLAEELGFDTIWAVEHHFFDYSFCPDNTVWLAHLAARTSRIGIGTAAIILPWNDPLRVAEKVAMLDHLAGGRVRLGMGRGLSRREYEHFRGIELGESRARFDEASMMVQSALETGWMEGEGPFYPQPRTAIRPAPARTFRGRTWAVASSVDSVEAAVRLRAAVVMFADRPWKTRMPEIERWREHHRATWNEPAPVPLVCDFVYCHEDPAVAEERGKRYLTAYLMSILEHYELLGTHFAATTGYEAYASAADVLRERGVESMIAGFLRATAYGTPAQMRAIYRERYELLGPFDAAPSFRFGGIPLDEAEASMRLFAAEVMPEIQGWKA
jgi:alkanesulfonate monooxygenase SsuD/methylene tetrahydromethanopterin reductase-like flavin-dependent oxidoreductase (luciferase family)